MNHIDENYQVIRVERDSYDYAAM